jgi:F-type H+-transporting ATPase subunit alpha
MNRVAEELDRRLKIAGQRVASLTSAPSLEVRGRVQHVGDSVASVSGLPETRLNELLLFERGGGREPVSGIALSLDPDLIGCALLGPSEGIQAGNRVRGTGNVARVPVGEALLGRVVNALGAPLDGGPALTTPRFEPIEKPAPAIVDRDFVNQPLYTGLTVIDAILPLGRGQRELIIGDRETGKTAIAVDTIINQRDSGVICVYCAVGQKMSSVSQVIDAVGSYGDAERCIFVVAAADDPPGLQWLAPYGACTMAEYFSERGGHALLVIDDLAKHAIIYRQLALLLRNPPGREAYPGDIFYIHSRLLERAAKLDSAQGGGSLTALPIATTEEGNLSAYIPTNLVSITDGQIVLEPRLFHEGQKPAVNTGKSVSRVGGKTQAAAIRHLAESLRLQYAQFLELEIFTRFSGILDERTSHIIEHGRRIRAVLTQPQYAPLSLAAQVAVLMALNDGELDSVAVDKVATVRNMLLDWLRGDGSMHAERVNRTGELDEASQRAIREATREIVKRAIGGPATSDAKGEA